MVNIDGTRYRRSFAEKHGLLGETAAAAAEETDTALITSPPANKARAPRSAGTKAGRATRGAKQSPAPSEGSTPSEGAPAEGAPAAGEGDPAGEESPAAEGDASGEGESDAGEHDGSDENED
jgi:hypothetical protein